MSNFLGEFLKLTLKKNADNVKFRYPALIFCLIMSHICKFHHRKKVLGNFWKFISQEWQTRILIWNAFCPFLTNSSNDNYVHNQIMTVTKVVIKPFYEKLQKLEFMFVSEIQFIKDVSKMLRNKLILKY